MYPANSKLFQLRKKIQHENMLVLFEFEQMRNTFATKTTSKHIFEI